MAKKVLFFFPHNPVPQTTGAHKRCIQMLTALADLGCDVTFFGSTMLSNTSWRGSATAVFFQRLGISVQLHRIFPFDYEIGMWLKPLWRRWLWRRKDVLSATLPAPPGMQHAFLRSVMRLQPDVLWMNYACWDSIVPRSLRSTCVRVVDSHDVITINMKMQRTLEAAFRAIPRGAAADEILEENFVVNLNPQACSSEFDVYDRYDFTVAISAKEADLLRRYTRSTTVCLIPMTFHPVHIPNTYDDAPILALGNNLFNLHGLYYFVTRVLPIIHAAVPDSKFRLTGHLCKSRSIPRSEQILYEGFVPDLAPYYRKAGFAICPVFSGTGQQIKILEAMAHGLPVIALKSAAEATPLRHGYNGLIANDAAEFARHVLHLLDDSQLRQTMGANARQSISEDSYEQLLQRVEHLLNMPPRRESIR